MTEQQKEAISRSNAVKAEYLVKSNVSLLSHGFSADEVDSIQDLVIAKECFNNALLVTSMIDAGSVVLGYVWLAEFGIGIEHAWIEYNGVQYDPTLEKLTKDHVTKNDFYELFKIPLDSYFDLSETLGMSNYAIDVHSLRKGEATKDLFLTGWC